MAHPVFTVAQIAAQLQRQWGGTSEGTTRTWNDGSIEYAMPDAAPNNNGANEASGFTVMTATQKAFAREAFELWDDLIQSSLTETTSQDAQITLAYSSMTDGGGTYTTTFLTAQPPNSSTFDREIDHQRAWMSTSWTELQSANIGYGERGLETYIHEIGHALGLSHPGSYNAGDGKTYATGAEYSQDTLQWTIMSYWNPGADGTVIDRIGANGSSDVNNDGINAATPLLHDIAAIQSKYGADVTTRTGDTVYGFNSNANRGAFHFDLNPNPVVAIWDAGGIDMLDSSGYSQNQRIDLRAGTFSDIGALTLNVAIAYNVVIENAIGGAGNDYIGGNQANNWLRGGAGNDVLEGFDGNDTLDQGETFVFGLASDRAMYGGNGDDTLWASAGAEIIDGGNGSDLVNYSRSNGRVVIDTTAGKVTEGYAAGDTLIGIEHIIGTAFNDYIVMGDGDNFISGGDGNDTLNAGAGSDSLYGSAGNDELSGGAGADLVDGGTGTDTAGFEQAVVINLATGVHGGEAAGDGFFSIEQYRGGAGADIMIASASQAARFIGGDGNDTLLGSDRDDWLQGGKGQDTLSGGNGFDMVSYADAPNRIVADLSQRDDTSQGKITAGEWGLDKLTSIEDVEGTAFNDTLLGDEGSNKLLGLGGDDFIDGRQGTDFLLGGAGNDTITAGESDFVYGGEGWDSISFFGGAANVNVANQVFQIGGLGFYMTEFESYIGTAGADFISGANYAESYSGGAGSDVLLGAGGNDTLGGGAGFDFVYGEAGDDFFLVDDFDVDLYDGGTGRDTIVFGHATVADWQAGVLDADIAADSWVAWEVIQGSAGNDRIRTNSWGYDVELRGGAGADVLAAGNGNDTLVGEGEDDVLSGGAGADTIIGGAGSDTLYDTAANMHGDAFADFAIGDVIDVNDLRFTDLRYSSATGVLEMDTLADGSYATRVQLGAGLQGEFITIQSVDPAAPSTVVRLMLDTDGDGVGDFRDNATLVPNADQRDSDGDGYGNVVDPDLNQDLIVDIFDLSLLDERFGSSDADADFNGDGSVDLFDLSVLDGLFGGPPGASYVNGPNGQIGPNGLTASGVGAAEELTQQLMAALSAGPDMHAAHTDQYMFS